MFFCQLHDFSCNFFIRCSSKSVVSRVPLFDGIPCQGIPTINFELLRISMLLPPQFMMQYLHSVLLCPCIVRILQYFRSMSYFTLIFTTLDKFSSLFFISNFTNSERSPNRSTNFNPSTTKSSVVYRSYIQMNRLTILVAKVKIVYFQKKNREEIMKRYSCHSL